MALPTYNELKGLDWGYGGQPFLNTPAKTTDLTSLDYAYQANPFDGNNYGSSYTTINRDCQFKFNVYNLVNKDKEFKYRIYEAVVNKDTQFLYNLFNAVGKNCVFAYRIGSPVYQDGQFKYRVLSAIHKDCAFNYLIGVLCHNDCQFNSQVYGFVNRDSQFKYNLGYIINNDCQFKNNVYMAIHNDKVFKYNIGYIIGNEKEFNYIIMQPIHADSNFNYTIGEIVNKDVQFVYKFASIFKDLTLAYRIGELVNKDTQFKFHLLNLVNTEKQFKYYIGELIDKDCEFSWNYGFAGQSLQAKHNIILRPGTPTHLQSNLNNQIGRWRFNESGYTGVTGEVKDSSGYGHHGKADGTISTVSGLFGNAVQFNGDVGITIPDDSHLDLTSSFSILMYIRPEQYNGIIVWKGGSIGIWDVSNYKVGLDASGHIYFGSNEMGWLYSNSILDLLKYYFIACEFHGGTQLRIFVNAILDNAQTALGHPTTNAYPLSIGTSFKGRVDELCLLNQSLIHGQFIDTYFKQPTFMETIHTPS